MKYVGWLTFIVTRIAVHDPLGGLTLVLFVTSVQLVEENNWALGS
jgi:hypothetical protein